MIKIENTDVYGWEAAIRGARNPMNSWDKMDSGICENAGTSECGYNEFCNDGCYWVGPNDHKLLRNLTNAGPDHGKFMRMITVSLDITAPLYWWKEFDTYKVGTVANSCSTMHKIHAKEFTLDDFSLEHLNKEDLYIFEAYMHRMEANRKFFLALADSEEKKEFWYRMIQLLPTSYNQRRTVLLNYQVLKSMYHARKNHKLDEWHVFCDWIRGLPYAELITGEYAE
jgi:hypothetical protein